MSEKARKHFHDLKIEEGILFLDEFKLRGVNKYMLNYAAPQSTTELVLKLRVNSNIRMGNQDKKKAKGSTKEGRIEMNYYFVGDKKGKRHIVAAKNAEDLSKILKEGNVVPKYSYMLKSNTFDKSGFLISDK